MLFFPNFGPMWLVNELVSIFSDPIKYAKARFNPKILSRNIEYTTYYYYFRRTDVKTVFSDSGGFET